MVKIINTTQSVFLVVNAYPKRMTNILTRYQSFKKEENLIRENVHEKLASKYRDVCTADEITEMIQRHIEENIINELDIIGLDQLEHQLGSFLQQVRLRKTQVTMEVVKALQDEEIQLKKERNLMIQEITKARIDGEQSQVPVMDIQVIW